MTDDLEAPPPLPRIRLEQEADLTPAGQEGFLRIARRRLRATYPDGTSSEPFAYDEVQRRAMDAVVIAAHFAGADGGRRVYLRSALRPPVAYRDPQLWPPAKPGPAGGLWELPAGLVEPDERGESGVRACARRELFEELGFRVDDAALRALGPSSYPAPAVLAERHIYFEVEVEPGSRREPPLDGSPLEHFGQVVDVALDRALDLCRSGVIEDAKTELALRRLREAHP